MIQYIFRLTKLKEHHFDDVVLIGYAELPAGQIGHLKGSIGCIAVHSVTFWVIPVPSFEGRAQIHKVIEGNYRSASGVLIDISLAILGSSANESHSWILQWRVM